LKKLELLTKLKSLKKRQKLLLCTAVLLLCFTGWVIWGNISLQVTEYTIASDRIPDDFDNFRIVQISDLHNAEFGADNVRLLEKIREQNPDIIVITGDIVDSRRTNLSIALSFAEQAVQIAPTYYVPGNHEGRLNYRFISKSLQNVGVIPLLDKRISLTRQGEKISLLGLIDDNCRPKGTTEDALISLMEETDSYTLLLSHRPTFFDDYVASGADLVLTGHIHGGQFRLPFIGGLYAPGQGLLPKYDAGLFTEGQTNMIISRGLGNSAFPFRINNRPEIVVVTLKKG
jgi:predicted MPP superfamily phosphohydrolase